MNMLVAKMNLPKPCQITLLGFRPVPLRLQGEVARYEKTFAHDGTAGETWIISLQQDNHIELFEHFGSLGESVLFSGSYLSRAFFLQLLQAVNWSRC